MVIRVFTIWILLLRLSETLEDRVVMIFEDANDEVVDGWYI